MLKDAIKYGVILAVICLAASGLLAGVNKLTKARIEVLADEEKSASFKEVMPQAEKFEAVQQDGKEVYYRAYDKNSQPIGAAFVAQAKGYSSTVETVVGMLDDGTITAVKVISQNETPGLGTRVTEIKDKTTLFDVLSGRKAKEVLRPWFQEQFSGKKSDLAGVQGISGATVTSRAVMNSVKKKADEVQKLLRATN